MQGSGSPADNATERDSAPATINLAKMLRTILLAGVLALSIQHTPQPSSESPVTGALPMRSQQALEAYLHDQSGVTPFDALPPGARERFLLSLRWGGRGLTSLDLGILADELPQPGIEAILRLFGDEFAGHAPASRLPAGPPPASTTVGISDLERRYNAFYRALQAQGELDNATLLARLKERFSTFADAYAPAALEQMDYRHLAMLWNAASVSARLSEESGYVDAMEAVFAETVRRHPADPPVHRLRQLRAALLLARRFEDAGRLAERHPDSGLPVLPAFVDPFAGGDRPTHSVWVLSTDGTRLTRQALDLTGTRLVVTASHGCGFSRTAAADIAADPVLGPAFARRATWLMLPPGAEGIDGAIAWNRLFPQAPPRLMYGRDAWPHFADWRTPVFHVLRDGRIVDALVGWPRDDGTAREALIDMLRRHDLAGDSPLPR
jgi:hypothetical protein